MVPGCLPYFAIKKFQSLVGSVEIAMTLTEFYCILKFQSLVGSVEIISPNVFNFFIQFVSISGR